MLAGLFDMEPVDTADDGHYGKNVEKYACQLVDPSENQIKPHIGNLAEAVRKPVDHCKSDDRDSDKYPFLEALFFV
jgi:hypothetical protein